MSLPIPREADLDRPYDTFSIERLGVLGVAFTRKRSAYKQEPRVWQQRSENFIQLPPPALTVTQTGLIGQPAQVPAGCHASYYSSFGVGHGTNVRA